MFYAENDQVEQPQEPDAATVPAGLELPSKTADILQFLRSFHKVQKDRRFHHLIACTAKLAARRVPAQWTFADLRAVLVEELPVNLFTDAQINSAISQVHSWALDRQALHQDARTIPRSFEYTPGKSLTQVRSVKSILLTSGGAFLIRAPMASGKTKDVIAPFVAAAKKRGWSVLAITPRVALTHEQAHVMGCLHYTDDADTIAKTSNPAVAVCLPSITREDLVKALPISNVVIMDEAMQNLTMLSTNFTFKHLGENGAQLVFDRLVELIRAAKVVILADAQLGPLAVKFLDFCRPNMPQTGFNMDAAPNGKTCRVHHGLQKDVEIIGIDAITDDLRAGGNVMVTCEYKSTTKEIAAALIARGTVTKDEILVVNADTVGGEQQRLFLHQADRESRKYRALIVSPTVESGISITHQGKPHFTLGVHFGSGFKSTASRAIQQICRVRYLTKIVACIKEQPVDHRHYLTRDMRAGRARLAYIAGNEKPTINGLSSMRDLMKKLQREAQGDFAAAFCWALRDEGWTVLVGPEGKQIDDKHLRAVKAAVEQPITRLIDPKEENPLTEQRRIEKARLFAAMRVADWISDATAAERLNSRYNDQAGRDELAAWRFRRDFGRAEITQDDFDQWVVWGGPHGFGADRIKAFETYYRPDLPIDGLSSDGSTAGIAKATAARTFAQIAYSGPPVRSWGPDYIDRVITILFSTPQTQLAAATAGLLHKSKSGRVTKKIGNALVDVLPPKPTDPKEMAAVLRRQAEICGLEVEEHRAFSQRAACSWLSEHNPDSVFAAKSVTPRNSPLLRGDYDLAADDVLRRNGVKVYRVQVASWERMQNFSKSRRSFDYERARIEWVSAQADIDQENGWLGRAGRDANGEFIDPSHGRADGFE